MSSSNNKTQDLMASLMGGGGSEEAATAANGSAAAAPAAAPASDLFGDLPVDDGQEILPAVSSEPPLFADDDNVPVAPTQPLLNQTQPPMSAAPVAAPPPASSLLEQSGLLLGAPNAATAAFTNSSGGLFDGIDQEEQRQAKEAVALEAREQFPCFDRSNWFDFGHLPSISTIKLCV